MPVNQVDRHTPSTAPAITPKDKPSTDTTGHESAAAITNVLGDVTAFTNAVDAAKKSSTPQTPPVQNSNHTAKTEKAASPSPSISTPTTSPGQFTSVAWNTPETHPDTSNKYSNAPRYIGLGQYGKGIADDFAGNYGGVNEQQRQAILDNPGSASGHLTFTGPVDPNQVIAPVKGTDEQQAVDGSLAGSIGTYAYLAGSGTFSTGAAVGAYNEYAKNLNAKLPTMGADTKALVGHLLGNLGSSLYLAGSIANVFATHSVDVGAAVNNAESAQAFNNNVALFGINAEGGQRVMDNQTEAMNKATNALTQDSKGNFKDPEYAMRTVNQLMKLSGQDPLFTASHAAGDPLASLPEVTTANGQVDTVLPADIFALGGASKNATDLSSSLSNRPDSNATGLGALDQRHKNDAQDVTNVSQGWLNKADKFVKEGDYTNASGRQTGMTRMVNELDGQLQKTGDSLSKYNDAEKKFSAAVKNVMDPKNTDSIASQAGVAIRNNYAAEEGVDAKNVQPVSVSTNVAADPTKTTGNRTAAAYNTFFGLDQNAKANMNTTFDVGTNSNLWQIQQQLHSSLMSSGTELTPFKDIAQHVATNIFGKMNFIGEKGADSASYNSAKDDFTKAIKANPGLFPATPGGGYDQLANNIFKSGLNANISFMAYPVVKEDPKSVRETGNIQSTDTRKSIPNDSVNVHLQTDDLQNNPGAVFDQIWNAVSDKVKQYPSNSNQGWHFGDISLNGLVPQDKNNKVNINVDNLLATSDHYSIGGAPEKVQPPY